MNRHSFNLATLKLTFSKPIHSIFSSRILISYTSALLIVTLCTLVGSIFFPYVNSSNLIMLYLLGVVGVASLDKEYQGPSIFASLLSTLAFDFFFVPPYFSFAVSDTQYFFTLLVMLIVSQLICHLNFLIKRQSESAQKVKIQIESEKMRNILLTSISHDLRTPLTAIMGSASILLESDNLSHELSYELAKNIYEESKRLNHHVTNILQMIRLESRSVKITKELYYIEEIINNTIARLTEKIGKRHIDIHLGKNLPLIPVDLILIQQVFVNLLENAIKYSPPDSPIEISARLNGQNILIKISDHGPGIEENEIENIFDKFYRSKKTKSSDEGFGLGLAICKNIIQLHGGKIWVENRKDGGSLFYFTLPV